MKAVKTISKKVVKETTGNKKVSTVTKVMEKQCGCDSFECLSNFRKEEGVTMNADKSLEYFREKTIEDNGRTAHLTMKVRMTPVFGENGNNTILIEETKVKDITIAENEKQEPKSIKDIMEMFNKINNKEDLANNIHSAVVEMLKGKVDPENIKVINMGSVPSFEEFKKMIMK